MTGGEAYGVLPAQKLSLWHLTCRRAMHQKSETTTVLQASSQIYWEIEISPARLELILSQLLQAREFSAASEKTRYKSLDSFRKSDKSDLGYGKRVPREE